MTTETQQGKKKRIWILLLFVLIAVDLILCFFILRDNRTLTPDYAPVEEETYAKDMGDDDAEKLKQQEGGGAVSLSYTNKVTIDKEKKQASLYFANPYRSNQDIVLQVIVQDVVVAQSGTISPGKEIDTLDLLKGAAGKLQKGGYQGKFAVLYYQPDTHEKTIVNTEIPVEITVE